MLEGQTHVWETGTVGLRLAPSVRVALERRCAGACEACRLDWRWALYVFKVGCATGGASCTPVATAAVNAASSPSAALGPCLLEDVDGSGDDHGFEPVRGDGADAVAQDRRKALIAARGAACEICGASAAERVLQVHHRLAVLMGGDDREDNLQVLCFACHHRLQRCATGCGAWSGKRLGVCQNCLTRHALERLMPDATWHDIKERFPGFVAQWKPGYEPLPISSLPVALPRTGRH